MGLFLFNVVGNLMLLYFPVNVASKLEKNEKVLTFSLIVAGREKNTVAADRKITRQDLDICKVLGHPDR